MGDWVDDFDSFQGSQTASVAAPPKVAKKPPTTRESIEAELKLLEWHKMANDAAMKAALVSTKSMKASGMDKAIPKFRQLDEKYMKKVINEENVRPLEVSRDYVLDYERKERENADRLSSQVEKHIHTLRNLRVKLQDRADLKERTEEYRNWERDFRGKKGAVFDGKTVEEYEKSIMAPQTTANSDISPPKKQKPASDLSHVLDSLNRLSELEGRISKLESGNMYDTMLEEERNAKVPTNPYDVLFAKKRSINQTDKSSMKVMYTIQGKGKMKPGQPPGRPRGMGMGLSGNNRGGAAGGGGIAAIRQQRTGASVGGNTGGGTFLTGVEDNQEDRRDRVRREQQMKLAQATSGQKNLRSRVIAKKVRAKEQSTGQRRHEEAMLELQKRKNALNNRKNTGNITGKLPNINSRAPGASTRAVKGASAGIKTNNRHLQEFQNMKRDMGRRREIAAKPIPTRKPKPVVERFGSRTAPAPERRGVRGQPATKGGGTLTRKSGNVAPTRRAPRGFEDRTNFPETAPPAVAVSGLKGIRSMKQRR